MIIFAEPMTRTVVKQTQKGKPSREKIANVETFDTVEEFCDFCSLLAF